MTPTYRIHIAKYWLRNTRVKVLLGLSPEYPLWEFDQAVKEICS